MLPVLMRPVLSYRLFLKHAREGSVFLLVKLNTSPRFGRRSSSSSSISSSSRVGSGRVVAAGRVGLVLFTAVLPPPLTHGFALSAGLLQTYVALFLLCLVPCPDPPPLAPCPCTPGNYPRYPASSRVFACIPTTYFGSNS